MDEEIWKPIIGYEGKYEVSNIGRVKSLHFGKERILKNCINREGYTMIGLKINNVEKKVSIHRLVANAFISNPYNKKQVNHINGVKDDNKICNLEWSTGSENCIHRYRVLGYKNPMFGKPSAMRGKLGKDHHSSKKISQYSKGGEFIREWDSAMDVERTLNINHSNIGYCCRLKLNTCGGFIWRYI